MPTSDDFIEFPVFGDNSDKEKPDDPKYAAGFLPGDVLPAEWLNWFLNAMSTGYNQLVNQAVSLVDLIYPVGSIYMSVNGVSPETFLGGTWERIQDTFLLAAGSTYSAGDTGGEATHTLTTSEMPEHSHTISHTHTRGTMEITGSSIPLQGKGSGKSVGTTYGAFKITAVGSVDNGTSSATTYINAIDFAASRTWSGSTSAPSTGSSGNAGNDTAHNNMPPYLAVYMWKRTA